MANAALMPKCHARFNRCISMHCDCISTDIPVRMYRGYHIRACEVNHPCKVTLMIHRHLAVICVSVLFKQICNAGSYKYMYCHLRNAYCLHSLCTCTCRLYTRFCKQQCTQYERFIYSRGTFSVYMKSYFCCPCLP